MKPLSLVEIQLVVQELQNLIGSQLQEIVTSPSGLALGHYLQTNGRGELVWIHLETSQNLPLILLTGTAPGERFKTKSPLHLFLAAHARGRRLSRIQMVPALGRAILFEWGSVSANAQLEAGQNNVPCQLEFRMIPTKVNLITTSENLSLSWRKLTEITAASSEAAAQFVSAKPDLKLRRLSDISAEWETQSRNAGSRAQGPFPKSAVEIEKEAADLRAKITKDVQKKEAAGRQLQVLLVKNDPQSVTEVADWIRDNWSLDIPQQMKERMPSNMPTNSSKIPALLASLYERIKVMKVQYAGQKLRLEKLGLETQRLQSLLQKTDPELVSALAPAKKAQAVPQAEKGSAPVGKRLNLTDSEFVIVGRSAAENLQILRDAQPWDLWLHLKDLPSAHGIVRRNRGQTVSDEKLKLAMHFVLKMTPKVARHLQSGDRVEGIVAECRFVSPLKGDHLGRVTVRESRTLIFKFDPKTYGLD